MYKLTEDSINGIKINKKIFQEELSDWTIRHRESFIDELFGWMGEALRAGRTDAELMKNDLFMLNDWEDEYIFINISTNIYAGEKQERFNEICEELLELTRNLKPKNKMKHNNPNITAEVIADSINTSGNRLTSLVITIPRIVLAEFNTHRAISRNSASSRAIPFKKMVEMVESNPFIPTAFQKEHKGMQGTEYFEDIDELWSLKANWLLARDEAVKQANALSKIGLTKQLCNRLLEPFMYHKIIATATEWQNFIALRAHDQAEIHIQDAAYKVLDALNDSTPKLLQPGEWHIPFGDRIDEERLQTIIDTMTSWDRDTIKVKIAAARCARISYNNFEGKDDYAADIKLHDMLKESGHMSPMEHLAFASDKDLQSGNFIGFTQYRKLLAGENKSDSRLIK